MKIYAALRLDMLPYLHIECFVSGSDNDTQNTIFWLASYSGCLLLLIGLNSWWPIRYFHQPIEWRDDMFEPKSSDDTFAGLDDATGAAPLYKRLARDYRTDEEEEEEFGIRIPKKFEQAMKHTRESWDDFFSVVYSVFFTFALRYAIDLIVRTLWP